ncbi:MAG: hypothetical protein NTU95_00065 [Methanothrix sp.]|jgi:hypothetical protein|nr:hypothetical protein [Methanothrix sp.]
MKKDDKIEEVSKVRFIYIQPEAREKHFINGAIGGLTPRGEIICNFFLEYRELPDSEEAVIEGGQLRTLVEPVSEAEIVREIRCSIILDHVKAREIAQWLVGKADEYDLNFTKDKKNVDLPAKL